MGNRATYLNRIVAALALFMMLLLPIAPAVAAPADIDKLLAELKSDDAGVWRRAESDLWREWSKSGSAAMDLLLERGRDAIDAGENDAAIEHLTALIDHAPDFAEAYNARATAYFQAGLYGPSVNDIGHALTLNPHHFGALAGLGMILEDTDHPARALEAYRASIAIHPHQPAVLEAIKRLEMKAAGQNL